MKQEILDYLATKRTSYTQDKEKTKKGYMITKLCDENTDQHGYVFYGDIIKNLDSMIKILNECEFYKKKGTIKGQDMYIEKRKIYYNERFEKLDCESKYCQLMSELVEEIYYSELK